jgi:hypothetical protein
MVPFHYGTVIVFDMEISFSKVDRHIDLFLCSVLTLAAVVKIDNDVGKFCIFSCNRNTRKSVKFLKSDMMLIHKPLILYDSTG